jgi:hypothetical protein
MKLGKQTYGSSTPESTPDVEALGDMIGERSGACDWIGPRVARSPTWKTQQPSRPMN